MRNHVQALLAPPIHHVVLFSVCCWHARVAVCTACLIIVVKDQFKHEPSSAPTDRRLFNPNQPQVIFPPVRVGPFIWTGVFMSHASVLCTSGATARVFHTILRSSLREACIHSLK